MKFAESEKEKQRNLEQKTAQTQAQVQAQVQAQLQQQIQILQLATLAANPLIAQQLLYAQNAWVDQLAAGRLGIC